MVVIRPIALKRIKEGRCVQRALSEVIEAEGAILLSGIEVSQEHWVTTFIDSLRFDLWKFFSESRQPVPRNRVLICVPHADFLAGILSLFEDTLTLRGD